MARVQVKTSTVCRLKRWDVALATQGGNQSWDGVAKLFRPAQCDFLFVHVGDGRRWFIPSSAVEGGSAIRLGGPKYEDYEIESAVPLTTEAERRIATLADPWRGSGAVKRARL